MMIIIKAFKESHHQNTDNGDTETDNEYHNDNNIANNNK